MKKIISNLLIMLILLMLQSCIYNYMLPSEYAILQPLQIPKEGKHIYIHISSQYEQEHIAPKSVFSGTETCRAFGFYNLTLADIGFYVVGQKEFKSHRSRSFYKADFDDYNYYIKKEDVYLLQDDKRFGATEIFQVGRDYDPIASKFGPFDIKNTDKTPRNTFETKQFYVPPSIASPSVPSSTFPIGYRQSGRIVFAPVSCENIFSKPTKLIITKIYKGNEVVLRDIEFEFKVVSHTEYQENKKNSNKIWLE